MPPWKAIVPSCWYFVDTKNHKYACACVWVCVCREEGPPKILACLPKEVTCRCSELRRKITSVVLVLLHLLYTLVGSEEPAMDYCKRSLVLSCVDKTKNNSPVSLYGHSSPFLFSRLLIFSGKYSKSFSYWRSLFHPSSLFHHRPLYLSLFLHKHLHTHTHTHTFSHLSFCLGKSSNLHNFKKVEHLLNHRKLLRAAAS